MKPLNVVAVARASSWAIVAVTLITILAEGLPGLKDWLAGWAGHHWVGKGWILLVVLGLGYWLQSRVDVPDSRLPRELDKLVGSAWISVVALVLYFLGHTLSWW